MAAAMSRRATPENDVGDNQMNNVQIKGNKAFLRPGTALATTIAVSAFFLSGCNSESPHTSGNVAATQRAVDQHGDPVPYTSTGPGVFVVDSEGDEPDAAQGDGICATLNGACTLRAAVQESNATIVLSTSVFSRSNVIILPEGHFKFENVPLVPTVIAEGTSDAGMLSVLGSTSIRGAGARKTVIDGNDIDRVFGVGPNAVLTVSDLTIRGATKSGIFNQGLLTVERCLITENYAGSGGGIFNTPTSTAVILDSTISNNVAANEGGGIRFDAAGLVINSTITGNRLLEECCDESTADGGTAGEGGGIDARGGGAVTIINSTITNNHAVIGGGGVNIATAYQGDPGGVIDAAEENGELLGRPIELINTIIAGNTSTRGPANCKRTVSPIRSFGGNISDDDSCFLNAENDMPNTNPRLAEFANHGGPTDTIALHADSPARKNGLEDRCPASDQRGLERPRPCDSGAFDSDGVTSQ